MSAMPPGQRPLILMLCAHEPTMDPRIRWEAEGAAGAFDVLVLGFNRTDGSLPAVEQDIGYEIRRLPHTGASLIRYARHLASGIGGPWPWILGGLAAPLVLPLAAAVKVAATASRFTRRHRPAGTGLLGPLLRLSEWTRVGYVASMLRTLFVPATEHFWAFVAGMPRRPDVVHCNDLDTLLVGILAKKRFGCRVVYDAHEYFPHVDPDGGWLDRTFFHWMEKGLARQADAVVTVNHLLGSAMARAYGIARIYSVPNAEPWTADRPPVAPGRMSLLAAGRVKFLFQGRFSPGRGLEELIDAWAASDSQNAALFLRGPENAWRSALVARASELSVLDRNVYFLDAVSEGELVAASAEADVGIIPYKAKVDGYKYACPNKLSQYLHAGVMVLANDLPYVRAVLEDADAGLIYSSERPESLIAAISRIAGDAELRQRSGANALRYAREQFNWQTLSATLYSLYASASEERSTTSCAASG